MLGKCQAITFYTEVMHFLITCTIHGAFIAGIESFGNLFRSDAVPGALDNTTFTEPDGLFV